MMKAKYIIILLLAMLMANHAEAGNSQVEKAKIYIFGMAASFTDTIVHFTPIQEVDSACLTKKKDFLLGREAYSGQLREYLTGQLTMPHRTCIVVYDKKRKKLVKKYAKMMRLYTSPRKGRGFDVRHIGAQDFRFSSVEVTEEEEVEDTATKQQKQKKNKAKDKERRPPHGK